MNRDARRHFIATCDLLKELCAQSNALWKEYRTPFGRKIPQNTIESYQNLIMYKHQIMREELENLIKRSPNFKLKIGEKINAFLYMPPLEENSEFVSILSLECDFVKFVDNTVLRLIMYRDVKSDEPKSFGVRFEGPHLKSKHQYWHMQLITDIRLNNSEIEKLPGCPDWLPVHVPCIPLRAKCPVTLIINIVTSLYGKGAFNKLLVEAQIAAEYIAPLKDIL